MAGGDPRQRTALVVTVLDEAASLEGLLVSIVQQTTAPDEVVIVDGGSRDTTWALLQAWRARLPLRLLQAPGASISRGRNLAVAATTADVIAVTDAGVRLDAAWLRILLSRLDDDVDVVSGFFRADPSSSFELAMGATVLPVEADVDPNRFLPSSRSVAFRRSAWASVGGYPEWLDYGEDLVFDLALKRAGCRFVFAPDAIVWFRPRGSFGAFFRQYYRYARGDGKADLWLRRHLIRYAAYVAGSGLIWRGGRGKALLLLLCGLAYIRRPVCRLAPRLVGLSWRERVFAVALVPAIRLVGDLAKMLGYPVGTWWRLHRTWTSRSSS